MFSIFSYTMSRVTHSEPGLPMVKLTFALPHSPYRRAQNALICIQTYFYQIWA